MVLGMHDRPTTFILTLLTLMSFGASVLAVGRFMGKPSGQGIRRVRYTLLGLCTAGSMGLFVYRVVWVHSRWAPLQSHVDGLVLIASLFAITVLFLQSRGGMPGLTAFGLPVLTVLLAWAICASQWSFYVFEINSVWKGVHLAGVYLGTLFFCVAAIASGMFLYAQNRLRRKQDSSAGGKLASLESIEGLIIRTSALGFGLLTLGLVTGLIVVTSGPTKLGPHWWRSPKIVLASSVWLIYALVMNTRHGTHFRGARAAWLSIVGLVLLLTTFGVVNALPAENRPGLVYPQEVP